MSEPQMNEPHIKLILQGVIVLCVTRDKKSFDIGIVKGTGAKGQVTGHDLKMEVWEVRTDGTRDLRREYTHDNLVSEVFLDIATSAAGQMEFFGKPTVDRLKGNDSHDFSWMLDLENDEMHTAAVTINPAALRSVLRVSKVEQGVFYTEKVGDKHLVVRDNARSRTVGRVAAIVKALIVLPSKGAIIKNGGDSCPLEKKDGIAYYEVMVKQACNSKQECQKIALSELYKDLYESDRPNGKIHLDGVTKRADKLKPFRADPVSGTLTFIFGKTEKLPTPK